MIPSPEAAVTAGVIDRATAQRLHPYHSADGPPPDTAETDHEKLRLVTGFNDIFVTIGLVLFPGALNVVFISVNELLAAPAVAAASWVLAVVALVLERWAILVSSLAYLAYAAGTLITAAGLESSSLAISALAVGAVVLMCSAAWRPLRRAFIGLLPDSVRQRLPAIA